MRSTILLVALSLLPSGLFAEMQLEEYDAKAAVLYQFTKFIQWPEAEPLTEIVVCLYRQDPFGHLLDQFESFEEEARSIEIRRVRWLGELQDCHMVFISDEENRHADKVIRAAEGHPLVTVGESEGFIEEGGMINLKVEGNQVRFEINQRKAKAEGIDISSKLLKLAARVLPP